jgi:hypothetical protein
MLILDEVRFTRPRYVCGIAKREVLRQDGWTIEIQGTAVVLSKNGKATVIGLDSDIIEQINGHDTEADCATVATSVCKPAESTAASIAASNSEMAVLKRGRKAKE